MLPKGAMESLPLDIVQIHTVLSVTYLGTCFSRAVGLCDRQSSLPIPTILQLCDLLLGGVYTEEGPFLLAVNAFL